MRKNFRLNASIQFGYTSIQDDGIAPLVVDNPSLQNSETAVILTPQENVGVYAQDLTTDTYLLVATVSTVSSVNYMIVSTR